MKLIKAVKVTAERNNSSQVMLKTRCPKEAYDCLKKSRKAHQQGATGTVISVKGVREDQLAHLSRGLCPVYAGHKGYGLEGTPLKQLGPRTWLHLELGITLYGTPPESGVECLKVV